MPQRIDWGTPIEIEFCLVDRRWAGALYGMRTEGILCEPTCPLSQDGTPDGVLFRIFLTLPVEEMSVCLRRFREVVSAIPEPFLARSLHYLTVWASIKAATLCCGGLK